MSYSPFLRRLGLALLTASVPILVMLMVMTLQGYRWQDHAPAMSDEINYWHQAGTWARTGLNGGYYVIDNTTARASFAHYYAWGFGPPVFYGLFASLFGWSLNGILNVNALVFFLSVVTFVLLARLDARRCLILAALLAVYPAILVYMPTSMFEPIYLAGALVVAGGLYRLHQGEQDRWLIVLTGVVLALMSLMRFTWALMFWPYLYYLAPWRVWSIRSRPSDSLAASVTTSERAENKNRLQGRDIAAPFPGERRWLWSLVGTVLLSGFFFILYTLTASPYRYALTIMIGMIPTEPVMALRYYIDMVRESVVWLVIPFFSTEMQPAYPPSLTIRLMMIGLLIWFVHQRRHTRTRLQREETTLVLYILGGGIVLSLFIYTTAYSVGFRFLSPYLLMTLALCIAWKRQGLMRVVIAVFVLTIPLVFIGSDTVRSRAFDHGRLEPLKAHQQEWHDLDVVYRPGADPWCNTFAYSIDYLEEDRLVALEPGMGISMIWWKPEQPQRAQFLMLTEKDYSLYPQPEQLTHLGDVPGGAVYRNAVRGCALP